jgi:type I restriction enzyme, S subunit
MSEGLPDGWEKTKLKNVLSHFQNGYAFSAKNYTSTGIPIVAMGHIGLNGIFNTNHQKQKYWDIEKKDELARYIVKSGDIIIAMTDVTPTMELIGRGCLVKSSYDYFLNQ